MKSGLLTIGVVARQSGVEVSTLRKWESRYGFPQPLYLASGQRRYTAQDVEKLRSIARRVYAGERAGKVIRDYLDELIPEVCRSTTPCSAAIDEALSALVRLDLGEFKSILHRTKARMSVLEFVEQFVSPLAETVGVWWAEERLPVYGEHLFSALTEAMLVQMADHASITDHQPGVLLATPSGETHTLGLAMANAVISSAGISCLRLPSHLPVAEIAACASAFRVRIVGVSASRHYPPRLLQSTVAELRQALAEDVELWLGGEGMNRVKKIPPGVKTFIAWDEALPAFKAAIGKA